MNKTFFVPNYNQTPNIVTMLDSLGNDAQVVRMLGCSIQTLQRWRKTGQCPKAAHYAIFWITGWGKSVLEAQAHRDASMAHLNATTLANENRALKRQLRDLEAKLALVDPAANAPLAAYGRFKR